MNTWLSALFYQLEDLGRTHLRRWYFRQAQDGDAGPLKYLLLSFFFFLFVQWDPVQASVAGPLELLKQLSHKLLDISSNLGSI